MSIASKGRPYWRRPVVTIPIAGVVLSGAMLQQTTFLGAGEELDGASVSSAEDATQLAQEGYENEVVPAITSGSVPVADVVRAALADPEAAGEELGKHEADGKPYSYAVTVTGEVVEGEFGELGLQVEDLPDAITIGVAVPPYGASTALRDVGLDVEYGDFENQIAYQGVAFELNTLAAQDAFDEIDLDALLGKRVTVEGATTWTSIRGGDVMHLTILPVSIEES